MDQTAVLETILGKISHIEMRIQALSDTALGEELQSSVQGMSQFVSMFQAGHLAFNLVSPLSTSPLTNTSNILCHTSSPPSVLEGRAQLLATPQSTRKNRKEMSNKHHKHYSDADTEISGQIDHSESGLKTIIKTDHIGEVETKVDHRIEKKKDGDAVLLKMKHNKRSIKVLWSDWTKGGAGLPSVDEMDSQFGPQSWIPDTSRQQMYQRRKVIIDAIRASPLYHADDPREAVQKAMDVKTDRVSLAEFSKKITMAHRKKQQLF